MRSGLRLLLISLSVVACGPTGEDSLWTERAVARDEVHLHGTSDRILRVIDLALAPDGRIWVLNSTDPFFLVFSPDGEVERAFGTEGGGPEEFGFPSALVLDSAGAIWAHDVPRHALVRVSGNERRAVPLPQDELPPSAFVTFEDAGLRVGPAWVEEWGGRVVVGRVGPSASPQGPVRLWDAEIVSFRLEPEGIVALESVLSIPEVVQNSEERFPGATFFAPYPIWTPCGNGFALYDPIRNQLRRLDPSGADLDAVDLPDEQRVPLSAEGMFRLSFDQLRAEMPSAQRPDSAEFRQMMDAQFPELRARSADVFPEYADLRCSADERVWLQRFDVSAGWFGRGSRWLAIDRDGTTAAWTLPSGFRPLAFTDQRIWGVATDELGVASVAWVDPALTIPGSLPGSSPEPE